MVLLHQVKGIGAIAGGIDIISLLLQENDMRFQEVNFVIGPQDGYFSHLTLFLRG